MFVQTYCLQSMICSKVDVLSATLLLLVLLHFNFLHFNKPLKVTKTSVKVPERWNNRLHKYVIVSKELQT